MPSNATSPLSTTPPLSQSRCSMNTTWHGEGVRQVGHMWVSRVSPRPSDRITAQNTTLPRSAPKRRALLLTAFPQCPLLPLCSPPAATALSRSIFSLQPLRSGGQETAPPRAVAPAASICTLHAAPSGGLQRPHGWRLPRNAEHSMRRGAWRLAAGHSLVARNASPTLPRSLQPRAARYCSMRTWRMDAQGLCEGSACARAAMMMRRERAR